MNETQDAMSETTLTTSTDSTAIASIENSHQAPAPIEAILLDTLLMSFRIESNNEVMA